MTRQWDRWAGTTSDIERATRLALDVLAPRTANSRCHIEIALPGRVTEAETPDALVTEIDTRDLTLVQSIRVAVGDRRQPKATIHVERQSPAVTVEVVGESRTRVEGLTSQLEGVFDRGRQYLSPNALAGIALAFSTAVVVAGVFVLRALGLMGATAFSVGGLVLLLLVFGAVGLPYGVNWLFPALELISVGSHTRARRFRLAIFAFVVSVVSSLAATLIYEVVR
jgi:hypothetical protein